jgi:hypothetical protein
MNVSKRQSDAIRDAILYRVLLCKLKHGRRGVHRLNAKSGACKLRRQHTGTASDFKYSRRRGQAQLRDPVKN